MKAKRNAGVPTDQTTPRSEAERERVGRDDWIATCAYFLAEARGFTPNYAVDDWLEAERSYMDRGLAKGESD